MSDCSLASEAVKSNFGLYIFRRAVQGGSSLFILLVMCNFTSNVDPIYFFDCCVNFVISLLYHMMQESHAPSADKEKLTRLFGSIIKIRQSYF